MLFKRVESNNVDFLCGVKDHFPRLSSFEDCGSNMDWVDLVDQTVLNIDMFQFPFFAQPERRP